MEFWKKEKEIENQLKKRYKVFTLQPPMEPHIYPLSFNCIYCTSITLTSSAGWTCSVALIDRCVVYIIGTSGRSTCWHAPESKQLSHNVMQPEWPPCQCVQMYTFPYIYRICTWLQISCKGSQAQGEVRRWQRAAEAYVFVFRGPDILVWGFSWCKIVLSVTPSPFSCVVWTHDTCKTPNSQDSK